MKKDKNWDDFCKTGSVESYLAYKGHAGTQSVQSEGAVNAIDNGRNSNRSKKHKGK